MKFDQLTLILKQLNKKVKLLQLMFSRIKTT